MACATLKRSLDWSEPGTLGGGHPAAKRRRCCVPFCTSPTHRGGGASTPPKTSCSNPPSPQQHYHQQQQGPSSSQYVTVFPDVLSKKLTPEYIIENVKAELRRIQRRKQLQHQHQEQQQQHQQQPQACTSMDNEGGGASSGGENSEGPWALSTSPPPPLHSERPLFTFKQVGAICDRMIREVEAEIRREYDSVLATKLAEQYEAFVRFTYDQIHRNYNAAPPSYLS